MIIPGPMWLPNRSQERFARAQLFEGSDTFCGRMHIDCDCRSQIDCMFHRRRKNKAAMAPMWQKVYDANYHKSLDHRSFYFKQTDKRSLGAKGMLSDIRELVEKRRLADGGLAAVSAAADFSARLHPDIT